MIANTALLAALTVLLLVAWLAVEAVDRKIRKANTQLDAVGELLFEGINEAEMAFSGWVDARYRGQSYELTIPFASASAERLLLALTSKI